MLNIYLKKDLLTRHRRTLIQTDMAHCQQESLATHTLTLTVTPLHTHTQRCQVSDITRMFSSQRGFRLSIEKLVSTTDCNTVNADRGWWLGGGRCPWEGLVEEVEEVEEVSAVEVGGSFTLRSAGSEALASVSVPPEGGGGVQVQASRTQ